jgi:phospholipid/cholesterol/gamma-HCH transport system substrate-binding protein
MTAIRDHISHRPNRARVALEVKRSLRSLAAVVVGLALALAGLAYIASRIPGHGGLTKSEPVQYTVADATGVVAGRDEVRVSGIPAGTITQVKLQGGHAILTAAIDRKYAPIYRDARAQLRPNTPLQDMYLDIVDRGTPAGGRAPAGRPLPEPQTSSSVSIADVLQMFNADTRARLRTTLAEFGAGVDGEGAAVRNAFVSLTPLLDAARRLTVQVSRRTALTRRLTANTATLTEELGRRQVQLRRLVSDAGTTLAAVQDGRHGLDATLRELPPTLTTLADATSALGVALPDVDTAVRRLQPVADRLPGSLASLRRLSDTARPALDALRPAVEDVSPLISELRPASANLARAVHELQPQAGAIDHVTTTLGRCTFVLQRFFQWTQSVFATGDARGVAPRGDAAVSLDSTGLPLDAATRKYPSNCGGGTTLGGAPAAVVRP